MFVLHGQRRKKAFSTTLQKRRRLLRQRRQTRVRDVASNGTRPQVEGEILRTVKRISQRLYMARETVTFRVVEGNVLFRRCMQVQREGFAVRQRQLSDAADAFRLRAEQLIELEYPAYVTAAFRLMSAGENHVRCNSEADKEV